MQRLSNFAAGSPLQIEERETLQEQDGDGKELWAWMEEMGAEPAQSFGDFLQQLSKPPYEIDIVPLGATI